MSCGRGKPKGLKNLIFQVSAYQFQILSEFFQSRNILQIKWASKESTYHTPFPSMGELKIPEHFPQVKIFPAVSRPLPMPMGTVVQQLLCPVLGAEADALNSSAQSLSRCKATSAPLSFSHSTTHAVTTSDPCTTSGSDRQQVRCLDSSDLKKPQQTKPPKPQHPNTYSFSSISRLAPLSHFSEHFSAQF